MSRKKNSNEQLDSIVETEGLENSSEKHEESKPKVEKHKVIIAVCKTFFSHISEYSPVHSVKQIRNWQKNQIVRDEQEIEFLLSINAPIEIFYRDE